MFIQPDKGFVVKSIKVFTTLVALLLLSQNALTQEVREFYNGVRALGMGGASLAVTNDETSLITNPAGLGKLRDIYGTVIDPELELGSAASKIQKANSTTDPFSTDKIGEALVLEPDTYYHAKAQVFPSFVVRNFGIGILYKNTLDGIYHPATDELSMFYQDDLAVILGFNFRIWGGRIKIGFNGQLINRIELDENNLTKSPTTELEKTRLVDLGLMKEGTGLSLNGGILLAAPWTYLPTIGAVIHDIGGTSFDKGQNQRLTANNRPNTVQQDIDVAAALFPIHTNTTRSSFTLEYRNLLTNGEDSQKFKYMHGGFEVNFADHVFLRAGYHQKYWTAGFEISNESFQFQMASYGEEVGTRGTSREDRRYVAKAAFRY